MNTRRGLNFGVMIGSFGNKTAKVQPGEGLLVKGHMRMMDMVIPVAQWYPEKRRESCISLSTRVVKRGE